MNKYLNPLLKIGLMVVIFRTISIFIYYFDSSIVSTPAHLIPMALFSHLCGVFGFMLLLEILSRFRSVKPIVGLISVVIFPLFILLGEIHFHLERLSGQPLHWNIFTTYLGTGFVGNMDVIGPLFDSIGLLSISVFFFLFITYYSIKKYIEFIKHSMPYKNVIHFVGSAMVVLITLCIYGPGSSHHAIYVVQPPEWNLVSDLLVEELEYSEEQEKVLIDEIRELVGINLQESWVDNTYPIMRSFHQKKPLSKKEKPDIFLLVVESLRGKELQMILNKNEKHGLYKNLKELANRGVYYQNYNSNGYPTVSGIFSMHTSTVPHLYQNNITEAQAVSFDGIASRIQKQGYRSVALWGGNPGHVNELKWVRRWFDDFDFIVPGDYLQQSINRSDAEVYRKLIQRIEQHDASGENKPFFGYVFTGMTHKPYKLENAYFSSKEQKQESMDYAGKAVTVNERYSASLTVLDLQVGKLLAHLDTRAKKDNTLIFLVGDHSMNTDDVIPPELVGYPIDDLVWTGAIIAGPKSIVGANIPRVETFPSSHSDLLPTILSVFSDTDPYSAFGTDLLNTDSLQRRFSLSVGPKGIRFDQGDKTLFFSNRNDGNYWVLPRLRSMESGSLMDKTIKEGVDSEKAGKILRALNYWSALVNSNRVWKNIAVTE